MAQVAGTSKSSTRKVTHLTVDERVAHGRAARGLCPRSQLAGFQPAADRDPVATLEAQAPSRVQELVPLRYGRMLTSPFAFYRGSAAVMAGDLAAAPRTGLSVQLCGDAHLANFGGYASPERSLVFDLNDFDETLPGPFEWDAKRLAASFEIAGRHRDFSAAQCQGLVLGVARSYRESMHEFAGMKQMDLWYARLDVTELEQELRRTARSKQGRRMNERLSKATAKGLTKDSVKAFAKLVGDVDGEPRILSDPPLIVPVRELTGGAVSPDQIGDELQRIFRSYRRTLQGDRRHLLEQFRMVDLARKVVGVGSVGTRSFIALLLGRDGGDPLFLQIKEAQPSVLEPYLKKSEFANHGQRVVEGQRLMQAASDIFLGWVHVDATLDGVPRDFYVRQLWDWKTSVDLDVMLAPAMELYARVCGWTLARAHARSGDAVAIAAYMGRRDAFDRSMAEFASTYADQNQLDYQALRAAADKGRVVAEDDAGAPVGGALERV